MQRETVQTTPGRHFFTALLATGLILTGTSVSYETGGTDGSSASSTDVFRPGDPAYDAFDALPHGACSESFVEPANDTDAQQARACVASQAGEIAVIDFTGNLDLSKAVAYQAEKALPAITRGVIHPRLVVTEASPAAKAYYAAGHDTGGCVDANRPDHYAAAAAEQTMSATRSAGYVVANTVVAFCDPRTLGAIDTIRARFADIRFPKDAAAGNPEATANELARRQIHEILHFYGVGHSGSIAPASLKAGEALPLLDALTAANGVLDIQQYAAGCVYAEYNDPSSVMGHSPADKLASTRLNPVNESALTDAVAVATAHPLRARQIADVPLNISDEESLGGALAQFDLEPPIEVVYSVTPAEKQQFDRLAIIPFVDRNAGEVHISGIDVGLIAKGNNYAGLGRVPVSESGTTFSLVVANTTITVVATPSGIEIAKR